MVEERLDYLDSGLIEMGPRRTQMQDSTLKIVRRTDGYLWKQVVSPPRTRGLRKDVFLYKDNEERFARQIEWLRFLGINSLRLVVDGVTGSEKARAENRGGYAAVAAVEGVSPLLFRGGVNFDRFYERVGGRGFDYAGFMASLLQNLNNYVREKGRRGKAVAALALEVPNGVHVAYVGDPVIELMTRGGGYQIVGVPDNLLWEGIFKGEITERPPGPQGVKGKAKDIARAIKGTPQHLVFWEVFKAARNSPLNVVSQMLGQRKQLDLRHHLFFIPKDPKRRSILGIGTDGIEKAVPASQRLKLFQKARTPEEFVARLRQVAQSRYRLTTDNVVYRMVPL